MTPPLQPSLKVYYGCIRPEAKNDTAQWTVWEPEFTQTWKVAEAHGHILGDADDAAGKADAQETFVNVETWFQSNRNSEEYSMISTGAGEPAVRRYIGRFYKNRHLFHTAVPFAHITHESQENYAIS